MLVHLLVHLIKKTSATAADRRLKDVVCEQCGTQYWYNLSRASTGTSSTFILNNRAASAQRAQHNAQKRLEKRLAEEAELVPCPNCHWISRDLIQRISPRKYRHATGVAVFLLFMGFLTFFLDFTIAASHSWPTRVGADVGSGFLFAAVAVRIIQMVLRRRINPNRAFPLAPAIAPGTPPAMVMSSDGQAGSRRLEVVDIEYSCGPRLEGWAVVRPGHLVFPKVCCLCLQDTTGTYSPRLRVNEKTHLAVPLCDACKRVFRRIWLLAAVITIVVAIAIGGGVAVASSGVDEFGKWMIGIMVALSGSIFGLFVIPNRICRPYRFGVIDKDRGIMKFASRNESYTELLKANIRQSEMDAARRTVL